MGTDELIALGSGLERILANPHFHKAVSLFEQATVAMIVATKPDATAEREQYCFSLRGVQDFVELMRDAVKQKDQLIAAAQPQPLDIDDPSVHDIYREHD